MAFAVLALAACALPAAPAYAADDGPLGATRLAPADATDPHYSTNAKSVTFPNVSGATLETPGSDDVTTGSVSPELVPEQNVLYLPASADISALRFEVDYYDLSEDLSNIPTLDADDPLVSEKGTRALRTPANAANATADTAPITHTAPV